MYGKNRNGCYSTWCTRWNIENEYRRTPKIPAIYGPRRYGNSVYGFKRKFSLLVNARIYGGIVIYGRNMYGIDSELIFVFSRRINRPTEIRFEITTSYLFSNKKQNKITFLASQLKYSWNTDANPNFRIYAFYGFEYLGSTSERTDCCTEREIVLDNDLTTVSNLFSRELYLVQYVPIKYWYSIFPVSAVTREPVEYVTYRVYTLRINVVCTENRKMRNNCNKTITKHTRFVWKVSE